MGRHRKDVARGRGVRLGGDFCAHFRFLGCGTSVGDRAAPESECSSEASSVAANELTPASMVVGMEVGETLARAVG